MHDQEKSITKREVSDIKEIFHSLIMVIKAKKQTSLILRLLKYHFRFRSPPPLRNIHEENMDMKHTPASILIQFVSEEIR